MTYKKTIAPNHSLLTLQVLRAEAACLVVMTHLLNRLDKYAVLGIDWSKATLIGSVGVKTFFIISGFIIMKTTENDFAVPAASSRFLIRRFKRVAPLYYIFTFAYLLKVLVVDKYVPPAHELILSYLFIPYRDPEGLMQPFYGLGWTLNFEMYFYLIVGFALLFTKRAGVFFCFAFIVLIGAFAAFVPESQVNPVLAAIRFLGDGIAFYFLFGMLIAIVTTRYAAVLRRMHASFCTLIASLLIVAALAFLNYPALLSACCILAVFFASLEDANTRASGGERFLSFLGDSSYSVYLTHSFVLGPLFAIALRFSLKNVYDVAVLSLAAIATSLAFGALVYVTIERPALQILRKRRFSARVSA